VFVFNDKEYSSKAAVVRELYDSGKASLDASFKKKIAIELGMTVQTVHATIMNHITKKGLTTNNKSDSPTKISLAEVQAKNKLEQKVAKAKSSKTIFINDKSDEVKKELMKDDKRIAVTFAPNQWVLPVTVPPLYVIDENYDPNWTPPSDVDIERSWE
jgi:hypothetical protein